MTTYPTYRSPIRTFQELGISTENIDANQLRLERKRLILEIQISDTQTTLVGDKELSKNDVLELFDELDRVTNLEYHSAIFNHPVLLNLLENFWVEGTILDSHKIRFETQEEWDKFIAFISPYMTNAFDKLLSSVIRHKNFKELERIRTFFNLVTSTDAFFAFRKFNNFCETLDDRLENHVRTSTTFGTHEVSYLSYAPFYTCVNELSKFYPNLPDTVATAVINFTVNSERKVGREKTLVFISDQVTKLRCSAKLQSIIHTNRAAFWKSREQQINYDPNSIWRMMIGIVIAGFLIFRVANRCESRYDDTYSSPDNFEMLKQFEELQKNIEYNKNPTNPFDIPDSMSTPSSSNSYIRRGSSEFDETAFLNLHERVVHATKFSNYGSFVLNGEKDPGILSRFRNDKIGTSYNIKNETKSDMVIVVWSGSNLNSFFVKSGRNGTFKATDHSCLFFYSGTKWRTTQSIQHKFNSTTLITFNGAFTNTSDEEFEFLRKYFTLTNSESKNFTIQNKDSRYELFQDGRFVNYSY